MLAVIKTGGKQYVVSPGNKIKIEKIDVEEGKSATFDEVLLFNDGKKTTIGDPVVKGIEVVGKVLKQDRSNKVKRGHRQAFTEVEITDIKKQGK
jgi:large subunit ribosomal protein L21